MDDFYSDLSKDIFGTRRYPGLARELYEDFVERHGEPPIIGRDGVLRTTAQDALHELELKRPLVGVTLNGSPVSLNDIELLFIDCEEV